MISKLSMRGSRWCAILWGIRSLTLVAKEVQPGEENKSEQDTKEFIKNECWGHHASCSNPIGEIGDPRAVLDSEFKVQGVEKLRVVDASVFPKIPGFFVAAPIYMISEKASDAILRDA